ncbi:MAG: MotA/TolQ/ExbB proton channel family protein [Akkermansiaceae bacterium]
MPKSLMIAQQTADARTAMQIVWKYFEDGGHFMYPLLLCLIVGFTIIVFKLLSLRRAFIIPPALAERVDRFEECVEAGTVEPLLAEFERGKTALARLAAVAVRNRGKSQADISEAVQTTARHEVLQLSTGMTALDVVIVVSPLLGLLGTASGLAFLFQEMAKSGDISNAQRIALGIAIALNTTIFGLAITIPCVIAQSFFNRKIESFTTELELVLSKLVHVCQKARASKN